MTRDEAGKLKEAGERQREKADKRNLYLLREGSTFVIVCSLCIFTDRFLVILPNTPAAENLAPAEVEKRTTSFNARKALLRSNPSLYVSRTRLSIRQLPLFVTERMLKCLAIHAIRSFEAEVKAGTRTKLSEDELSEPLPDPDDPEDPDLDLDSDDDDADDIMSKVLKAFDKVTVLRNDGSNWDTWQTRVELATQSVGLTKFLTYDPNDPDKDAKEEEETDEDKLNDSNLINAIIG